MLNKPTKDPAAVALGRKRWTSTGDDPVAVGTLGAEYGKLGGRPRTADRCPCGAMTAKRAKARSHKC